jgi:hypothetical protein
MNTCKALKRPLGVPMRHSFTTMLAMISNIGGRLSPDAEANEASRA